jgi:hypothetical protein
MITKEALIGSLRPGVLFSAVLALTINVAAGLI